MAGSFTDEERAYLRSLPAVADVRGDTIYYAPAFRASCVERNGAGESPTALFREAGLPPELVGHKRIERAFARWRTAQGREGAAGDLRKRRQDTDTDTRLRVLREVAEAAGLLRGRQVPKSARFAAIKNLHDTLGASFSITAACDELHVSPGGFYAWCARHAGLTRNAVEEEDGGDGSSR